MTPLGDGIRMAIDNWNADKKNDLSIVLMTNGMQNAGHQVVPDTIHPDLLALYDTEDGVNVPLRDKCILIQTIGVGAPGDVPSDLLNKIAEQTGGISDLTAVSTMDFSFQSALVESLKGNTMDLVSRVRSTLNRNVMDRTHEVTFNPSVKRAIFVLGWRSWADALELEVSKPPGRTSITPALKLENDNPDKLFYTVQAVNIPAEGPPGLWSVKVKRKGTNTSPIVYHLSIYVVEEKFAYRLGFNKADFGTGDDIILRAELSEKGLPLKNQDGALKVEVSRPLTALGSFLKAREVAVSQSPGGDDPESPYMRKLRNLLENTKLRRLIEPVKDTVTYTLYDSGNLSEHGDKKADDGIYSMKYTNTKVPGQYKFKVTLNTTTPVSGKISRVEERETMVMVKTADPDESEIYQEKLPGEKRLITIIPADQFGNFLGPGYEENISITSSVGNAPPIEDKRVNGTYTTIFSNVPSDVDPIYTIKLYGKEFFTGPISPPPERVIIGAYWGRNIPYNSLNIAYNSGWSLEGILEYLFSPRASIFASVGWNKFNPDLPGLEELKVINFSGNLKLYPVIGTFQLSIFGGGGYYLFDEPFEDRFGLNLGSAAELRISTSFSIEAKYNYNYVFTSGDKTKFATIQGGLRLRL
jgi:hypothetical protein